jgi:hypothetical protein
MSSTHSLDRSQQTQPLLSVGITRLDRFAMVQLFQPGSKIDVLQLDRDGSTAITEW